MTVVSTAVVSATSLSMRTSLRKSVSAGFVCLSAACWLALAGASPAFAQYDPRQGGAPPERYESHESRGLFGGLFGGNEAPRREEPRYAQQMSAPDLAVRLERLENQIRQLTGVIEQLQHRNQQLEQQVRRNQEDVDFRFQEAGIRGAPARRPPAASQPAAQPPAPASAPPQRRSDVFDPDENPSAPGSPQVLGSIPSRPGDPPPPIVAEDDTSSPAGAPAGRDPGAPLDLGTLADRAVQDPAVDPEQRRTQVAAAPSREPRMIPGPLPSPLPSPPPRNTTATGAPPPQQMAAAPTATPRDELAMAQGFIQRRDYAMAEEALGAFLKKYPNDRLTPDAHYWMGESLFQRRQFRDAAESFLTVSTKYEKSGRAPDALLRLGQSLAALGEREAACATLNEVGRKYPRASGSVRQTAEREQKRVRC
jgi:tol-pal system protein YbgF